MLILIICELNKDFDDDTLRKLVKFIKVLGILDIKFSTSSYRLFIPKIVANFIEPNSRMVNFYF